MQLNVKTSTDRKTLEKVAEERLKDFEVLRTQERYTAAIYLGVYAVECLLKARICKTLQLEKLPVTYRSHDLMALLLHSGVHQNIRSNPEVFTSLKKLSDLWNPAAEDRSVRYIHDPKRYGERTAREVSDWLTHQSKGVATWLQKQL